ncbi:MAG TPA: DNRLRE domain-containing protein [Planctomycetota bacterium]|nr:DNRLRE domain-containing protein [Planctomycetota bacterium]
MKRLLTLCLGLAVGLSSAAEDPLTLVATQDTTINPGVAGEPTKTRGTENNLMCYGPKHGNKDYRALVQFDLKEVPKTPVTFALLRFSIYKMYAVRKTKQDIIRVHRVLRPWGETSASWGRSVADDEWINKGGDFDPMPAAATPLLDSQTGEAAGKTLEFDVTQLVQAWQSGAAQNFGVILINADNESDSTTRPYSREAEKADDKPKLILHWANPPKRDPIFIKPSTLKPVGTMPNAQIAFNPSIKQGRMGEEFKDNLKAKGGIAPYTFKLNGELPPGLSATPEGALTGTPTKPGKYTLTVSITDSARKSGSGRLEIVVIEPDKKAPPEAAKDEKKPDPKKPDPAKPAEE